MSRIKFSHIKKLERLQEKLSGLLSEVPDDYHCGHAAVIYLDKWLQNIKEMKAEDDAS